MSSWQFDPTELTIRNIGHGKWEIDLRKLKGERDLLHWLLQAAKHDFNMPELFHEFETAISFCFGMPGVNGAAMLQDLFHTSAIGNGPINWETREIGNSK
jgi:hypothetical protein